MLLILFLLFSYNNEIYINSIHIIKNTVNISVVKIFIFMKSKLNLRTINERDSQLIYNWANDPSVRKNALQTNIIEWEEHEKWFDTKLNDVNTKIFILENGEIPVGQIRFEKELGYWKISYSIGQEHRGKGFGTVILEMSIKMVNGTLKACVKRENVASKKVFEKLGFLKREKKKEFIFSCRVNK